MRMRSYLLPVFAVTILGFSGEEAFSTDNVAKVIIMRGSVKAKNADGSLSDLKVDQSVAEGVVIQTADKSFVKLLFIDKSQMNLGPNSQMVINAFPKKEAGIITLVKGQIRSQVTKDYMEMEDKSKSKLFIKTKTAAMGIRGTDFQVNFNAENQNTSLITFEGKVAMSNIDRASREEMLDQDKLERVLSSDKVVMVTQGQISAVNLNVAERAMEPTKLGTKQLEALEKNETGLKESSSTGSEKQYRNPIPPGADGAAFSNSSPTIEKEISKMGVTNLKLPAADKVSAKTEGAEGFFNAKSGEYKLPAGSIIDLNTVNIIPPPANAAFDANTGTYVVPESYGKVDKVTGEYKAPAGLKLGVDGKFILVDAEAYQKAQAPVEEKKEEKKKEEVKEEKKEKQEEKKEEKKETTASTGTTPAAANANTATGTTTAPGAVANASVPATEASRAPASAATSGSAPSTTATAANAIRIDVPKVYDANASMSNFAAKYSVSVLPSSAPMAAGANNLPPSAANPQLQDLAQQVLRQNEVVRQTASDVGSTVVTPPTTKTKFIFQDP